MKSRTRGVGRGGDDLVLDKIHVAKAIAELDSRAAKSVLEDLFREGVAPEHSLEGRFAGDLVMLDIAPGLSRLLGRMAESWMPWQGKTMNAALHVGEDVFTCDSLALTRILFPMYDGVADDGPNTYRAFAFRTGLGAGRGDPNRTVLKIDYDLPENPGLTVRRVQDELVQVSEDLYLGKAHVRWWWGKWQTVAFFTLKALPA